MKLHDLIKTTAKKAKRVGRGTGSGKGSHCSGRGMKGQKARSKIPNWFEGGQLPLIRRTPFLKGKGRFKSLNPKPVLVSLTQLNKFKEGAVVDMASVVKLLKLNPKRVATCGLKIVATGKLKKKLVIKIPMSAPAEKILSKSLS